MTIAVPGLMPPLDLAAADRRERVRFALAEIGIASTSGLQTFVGMLYRFQPDRLAHAQRVAALAVAAGNQLGLPAADLAHLERAGLAHDIGKIVLPDPPTSQAFEWSTDRGLAARQAIIGAELLADVPFLRPAANVVRTMCEWVDGSGEPRGLVGSAIPVSGRVLGVADSLDVMATVCRELAWPRDLAVVELVRHAGIRFDADVVTAVLQADEGAPVGNAPWLSEPRFVC